MSRSEPVRRGLAVSRRTVIKGRCLVVVVAVGAAALDQAGKRILAVHAAGAVVGPVSVVLTHNTGVAFGILAGHPALAKVLDLGLTVLLLALAMRLSGQASTVTRVLWGLLLGGALGNAADRVGPAGVVDWLRVAGYPAAFNLADLFVRLAAVGLVISFLGRASGATRRDATPVSPAAQPAGERGHRHQRRSRRSQRARTTTATMTTVARGPAHPARRWAWRMRSATTGGEVGLPTRRG